MSFVNVKRISSIAGASLLLLSSQAFTATQSTAYANSKSSVVNLTYALWDPNEEVGYKKSIAVFEKMHPNIHVTVEQLPWNQYWQKLQTEMAAGDAPDVFWDHVAYFPQFASTNQLLNLAPYIKQDHVNLKQYYPALLKQYQYKGEILGLPKDWDTIAVFYNKDLFKKLGIKYPSNLTWNPQNGGTFLKLAQKLTVDKKGKHPNQPGFNPKQVVQYGVISENSGQQFYYDFIASNGGYVLDKNFGTKMGLNTPKSQQALQFAVDLINKYHVSPAGSEGLAPNAATNAEQLFLEGKVAMYFDGDWDLTPNVQQAKFHLGVGLLPSGPAGRYTVMNGLSDGIYAKTPHPKEAWELEEWLASPQSEHIMASGGYVWPGIPSLAPQFAKAWAAKGIDVTPFMVESKGKTISFPITLNWTEASTQIDQYLNLLWLNKGTVKDITNQATQAADSDLSQ